MTGESERKGLFGWLKRGKPQSAPAPAPGPIAYPGSMVPNEPFASARSLGSPVGGPQSAHVFHTPQTNRNGG